MRRVDGNLAPDASPAADDPLARVLALEVELRTTQSLLAARDEAFRTLLARLVEVEGLVHQQGEALRVCGTRHSRLEVERDQAMALATGLRQLRVFRYSRAPRAIYGFFRRLARRKPAGLT